MPPSPPPDPPPLGPLLARLRQARGWSQQLLAARLCAASGVPTLTRHEVSRWERRLRVPGDFWLGWLAVVLDVPVGLLAGAAARSRRRSPLSAPPRRATRPDGLPGPAPRPARQDLGPDWGPERARRPGGRPHPSPGHPPTTVRDRAVTPAPYDRGGPAAHQGPQVPSTRRVR